MRDDIHKTVPRPPSTQRWVRMAVNDADRLSGRSLGALMDAQADTCRREISPAFMRNMIRELNAPPGLFGHLANVASPRDLGGRGGPLETAILSEAKRLLAVDTAQPGSLALSSAVASAMKDRAEADIRVTQAVLPRRDAKTPVVVAAMRSDAACVDYNALAQRVCDGSIHEIRRRTRPTLDLDMDLRVGGHR